MGLIRVCALAGLIGGACGAIGAEGLNPRVDVSTWPRWQARIGLATSAVGGSATERYRLDGVSVWGDYYFGAERLGSGTGGFRATSGLMIRPPGVGGTGLSLPAPSSGSLTVSHLARPAAATVAPEAPAEGTVSLPYLGVGYTGLSAKGGWGFSADIGLVARHPAGVRFGRMLSGAQSLDDAVRELRLAPMVQLGVSYSF